jgi:xanthosine phosphorylase
MTVEALDKAVAAVRSRIGTLHPRIGMVIGSGLGSVTTSIKDPLCIPYGEIPGFLVSRVAGHAGQLLIGRLGGQEVACLSGRSHLYEGHDLWRLRLPLRTLRRIGCEAVVIVSTVGSINPDIGPGRLVAVTDHINLTGMNPLTGPNDDAIGPRFPSLVGAYDADLRRRLRRAAGRVGLDLAEGIMVHHPGPSFETPAEIRAYRLLGGDMVGMSMAAETVIARHCGLKVLGVAAVTNMGAGLSVAGPTHDETLAGAAALAGGLERLLQATLEEWDDAV